MLHLVQYLGPVLDGRVLERTSREEGNLERQTATGADLAVSLGEES